MNLTQILYAFFWQLLAMIQPRFLRRVFSWGVEKRIYAENVKKYPSLRTTLLGTNISSPIGIQSDCRLDIQTIDSLIQLGAGFGTFGSYTLKDENDEHQTIYYCKDKKQRVFESNFAKTSIALVAKKLSSRRYLPHFVGASLISFNADEYKGLDQIPMPAYLHDFEQMTQAAAPFCDFLVINVSHPSSCLYQLISDESSLQPLIATVKKSASVAAPIRTPKILLKVPYDISDLEVKAISQMALKNELDGIVIAGPAIYQKNRSLLKAKELNELTSDTTFITGTPIRKGLLRLIREFRRRTNGLIPLIASGCIFSGQDVYDFLATGASAVEVGSSFPFGGPKSLLTITAEFAKLLKTNNIASVSDLIGMNEPLSKDVQMADLFD